MKVEVLQQHLSVLTSKKLSINFCMERRAEGGFYQRPIYQCAKTIYYLKVEPGVLKKQDHGTLAAFIVNNLVICKGRRHIKKIDFFRASPEKGWGNLARIC